MFKAFRTFLARQVWVISILLLLSGLLCPSQPAIAADEPSAISAGDGSVLLIENVGQFDAQALFQAWGGSAPMWLVKDSFWVTLVQPSEIDEGQATEDPFAIEEPLPQEGVNVKISFVGANPDPVIEPLDRLETSVNYFLGNDPGQWRSNVPVWGGVRYLDLYPGIDLEVFSESGQAYQRLVASEGADLNAVKLDIQGADAISIEDGQLLLSTSAGDYTFPLLQVKGVEFPRNPLVAGNVVSAPFRPEDLQKSISRVTSHPHLVYSTYLGNPNEEENFSIAAAPGGELFFTGASTNDFPVTIGSFHGGYFDAAVAKLNAAGTALVFATFIGGSGDEMSDGISIDADGNAFITGSTDSLNYPVTGAAWDNANNGRKDIFITKLQSNGAALSYSTYLGGIYDDEGKSIALDADGAAYITGSTRSNDFPVTTGAYDTIFAGTYSEEVYVAKLSPDGSSLVYATYLGEAQTDRGRDIAVDSAGSAYVTGYTFSDSFPTTTGAFSQIKNGTNDGFVVKMNSAGSALEYATFIGGTSYDYPEAIFIDANGAAFLTGETNGGFPTTENVWDDIFSPSSDVFVTKFNPTGTALEFSTYLGTSGPGTYHESGHDITVDAHGSVFVTGYTDSPHFPVTTGAFDTTYDYRTEGFFAKFNNTAQYLLYSSYLGGESYDQCWGITHDAKFDIYLTGPTRSANFPVTAGAFDTSLNGDGQRYNGFISKFSIPPHVPKLSAPANAATVTGAPAFTWTTLGDSSAFIFEYDDATTFKSPVFTSTVIKTLSYTPVVQDAGVYYWHVKAKDQYGHWSKWSPYRKITIQPTVPIAPALSQPPNGKITNVNALTLSWKSVPFGYKYQVQVSKTNTFSALSVNKTLTPKILKLKLPVLADSKYYWRVRTYNTLNQPSPWSPVREFTIDTVAPAAPKLTSPKDKAVIYTDPVFKWQPVEGASVYQISIALDPAFDQVFITSPVLSTPTYTMSLPVNDTYFWRVRARDQAGNWSDWSSIWKVTRK